MKAATKMIMIGAALALAGTSVYAGGDMKELWGKNCAACHGKDGKGETPVGKKLTMKDLSDAKVQGVKDEELASAIKEGVKEDGKSKMKGYGDKLTADEVGGLVSYIRGFKK